MMNLFQIARFCRNAKRCFRISNLLFLCSIFLCAQLSAQAQGSFQNLDFEHPIRPLNPDAGSQVPITNALPGWAGYIGGSQVDRVTYNTVSLGAAAIFLPDTNSYLQPAHGSYYVNLQTSSGGATANA